MPIYEFNSSGKPTKQRPLYITDSNRKPVLVRYVYEFDSSGTPRMVYGSGPDWLARYVSGETAEYNTEYITGISNAYAGKFDLFGNNGGPGTTLWGIQLRHGYGDAPDGVVGGNNHDETVYFRIIPNTINLFSATAISLVGVGAVTGSVHGGLETETYCYFGFGGTETEIFSIPSFTLGGDAIGHKQATIRTTFPINTINGNQEMYFKLRHVQRSAQQYSNSAGSLCLQQINVLYA